MFTTQLQLADPTKLQLVGVELTLVSHGRKKKKNNPHLASITRIDPTCLKLDDCLVGVWNVFGKTGQDGMGTGQVRTG